MDQNLQYLPYLKQNVFTTTSKVNAPTFRQSGTFIAHSKFLDN